MSTGRLSGGLAALVLAVGFASALAAGGPTRIVHYRVFTPSGKLVGVQISGTEKRSCFSGSIGLPRPDAWRCIVGNEILDPCLQPPQGPALPLVCVTNANHAVRLRLTKPLPKKLGDSDEASSRSG
jgi:hypothetical protein